MHMVVLSSIEMHIVNHPYQCISRLNDRSRYSISWYIWDTPHFQTHPLMDLSWLIMYCISSIIPNLVCEFIGRLYLCACIYIYIFIFIFIFIYTHSMMIGVFYNHIRFPVFPVSSVFVPTISLHKYIHHSVHKNPHSPVVSTWWLAAATSSAKLR